MIDKAATLAEVISTLGALASILWLYLDPGPEPFAASLVCLAVILGTGVRSRLKVTKMQDETLLARLNSIREIMKVTDDIPRIPADELFTQLNNDETFCKSLTSRLVRLFGLRRELIPFLEGLLEQSDVYAADGAVAACDLAKQQVVCKVFA